MNAKLSKLIRKYVKVTVQKDYRRLGTKDRPDYVVKQKIKKMNHIERSKFVQEMKLCVVNHE